MRSLFALLGGALVAFAGLGWYFQWYTFTTTAEPNGQTHIGIDLDTKKVKNDVSRGVNAGAEGLKKIVNTKEAPKTNP